MAKVLSQEQIERYRYDGYLFPFAGAVGGGARRVQRRPRALRELARQAGQRRATGAGARRATSMLPWVDALVRHPRILDVVEDLIGPDILVYTATWFIKEAHSPTFAAWHQDATYFGIEPLRARHRLGGAQRRRRRGRLHGGRVVAQGRPRQLHHAALGLENSINGGGQAIVERFYDGGGEMMALEAGQFSLHHTLCRAPLGAEPRRPSPGRARHQLHPGALPADRLGADVRAAGARPGQRRQFRPDPAARGRAAPGRARRATSRSTAATATITPSRSPRTSAPSPPSRRSVRLSIPAKAGIHCAAAKRLKRGPGLRRDDSE